MCCCVCVCVCALTVELGVLVPYPEEGREARDQRRPSDLLKRDAFWGKLGVCVYGMCMAACIYIKIQNKVCVCVCACACACACVCVCVCVCVCEIGRAACRESV